MDEARREQLAQYSLLEFVSQLSDEFSQPTHLTEWCALIEAALLGGVRGLCAVPIRHHKSETTYHGIAWMLCRDPTLRIILMVADHEIANARGKRVRQLCEAAGVGPERGQNVITSWQNSHGGGVDVMSAKQSRLGKDCDVLVFDDPISEIDANNPNVRHSVDMAIAHYTARAGRTGGKRGSVLGVMSRWHPDDPIGRRMLRQVGWTYIHARAITYRCVGCGIAMGESNACAQCGGITYKEEAFAPEVMPLDELLLRRAELLEADPAEHIWWSQFQNEPRADGGELYKAPALYIVQPDAAGFRDVIGVDMAYSKSRVADFFAIVCARVYGSTVFVKFAERFKADHGEGEARLRKAMKDYGHSGGIFSYISGPEIGGIQYYHTRGINIQPLPARFDKRTRSQKTIDAWNAGKILLPEGAPWRASFVDRQCQFRGIDGDDDDENDALVSLYDGAVSGAAGKPKALGKRRI